MIGARHLTLCLAVALWAQASNALPVFQEEYDYDGHHHEHHAPPPATSYATISTTHVKVQHPPVAHHKYAPSPIKYEYVPSQHPQTAYKYISLSEALALQQASAGGKYEEPSTSGYKYLAASPTYKYVQPPAVTTEPEAAEEPTNTLKYALKYEQNSFKQEQREQQQYEQPVVRYKYVAVPSYKYVVQQQQQQQAAAPEYGQQQLAAPYDFADDKQQY